MIGTKNQAGDNLSPALIVCPVCGQDQDRDQATLGSLGIMHHFRCRHCGWDWRERLDNGETDNG